MDYNLLTDILLSLAIIVCLGFLYEITAYITFNWYMMVVLLPIASAFQILIIMIDKVGSKSKSQNIREIKIDDIWALFYALPFWLVPIIVETGLGSLSVFIKYKVFGSVSIDDVYRICEIIPICLLVIPCFFVKLREAIPKYSRSYIYESFNFVGVGANILILIFGGWLTLAAINAWNTSS